MSQTTNLYELWDKTKELSKEDIRQGLEVLAKLQEEVGELAEVMLSLQLQGHTYCYKHKTKEDLYEEIADVLLVLMNLAHDQGLRHGSLMRVLDKKMNKWDQVNKQYAMGPVPAAYCNP